MPFKNTTASLVLAMPCLSINFYNQKSAYYQVLSFGALGGSSDRYITKVSEKAPGSPSQHQKYVKFA